MFVHRILHVLLNYSYIAILYSICQCTVQNVCPKNEKEEKKKINDIVNQTRWDSTSCVKEKQGAAESVGNRRNPASVVRRTLFISSTPTAQYVTLYPDMVNHYEIEKLDSPA